MNYIPLHVHSHFSLRDGYATIQENISRAKSLGMSALAMTEHGTTTGLAEFEKECKKQDIKPILGVEAYFCTEHFIKDRDLTYHMILLAKNNIGYHNILKMISIGSTDDYFYFKPRIDFDLLKEHHEGIICTTACRGGVFKSDNSDELIDKLHNIFEDDFYIEIQAAQEKEQVEFNNKCIDVAKSKNVPVIVTTDSHYAIKEDAPYHKLWCNASDGYYSSPSYYIASYDELCSMLQWQGIDKNIINESISNTNKIAEQCNATTVPDNLHNYPVYPSSNPKEEILSICRHNWKEKTKNVSKEDYPKYGERVKHEIDILEKVDYFNYLLIMKDMLKFCKDNNILVGYGRGSVTGSLVCYLMDITKIDPLPYNLVFERFCHTERVSPADVDTDVESSRRDDIIEYLRKMYGEVVPCRTVQYLSDRGAIKYAGNRLELEPAIVNSISTSIETLDDVNGNDELVDLARHFLGRASAYSQHACALMIFQKEPTLFTAFERQNDDLITAYEFPTLEGMGLLKLDVLAIQNLDIVHETLNKLDNPPDIYNLPTDDKEVFDMISSGKTSFCFQIESKGMTDFCRRLRPNSLSSLAAVLALFRPGALNSGVAEQYIHRKNGESYTPIHQVVESTLKDTYGCMFYQEDMMRLVQAMANMSMGEADMFRRAVGKKKADLLASLIPDFVKKCENNNIPKEAAEEVAHNIMACADYAFSLNHAQAYAFLTYLTAYMKVHYPLEYICSCLNANIDDTDKLYTYIKECKVLDIEIVPPNVLSNNMKFIVNNGKILYGLNAIKHVGNIELDISNVKSFYDFALNNLSVNKQAMECLVKSGACDSLGDRNVNLGIYHYLKEYIPKINLAKEKITLYEANGKSGFLKQWQDKLYNYESQRPKVDDFDIVKEEIKALGFTLSPTPKVKRGEIIKVFSKQDKNGKDMAWITFKTDYGDIKAVIFASMWKKIKSRMVKGSKWIICEENGVVKEYRELTSS